MGRSAENALKAELVGRATAERRMRFVTTVQACTGRQAAGEAIEQGGSTAARGPDHRTYTRLDHVHTYVRSDCAGRVQVGCFACRCRLVALWARLLVLRPIQYINGGPAHACSVASPKCKFFQTPFFLRINFFFLKRNFQTLKRDEGSTELVSEILYFLIIGNSMEILNKICSTCISIFYVRASSYAETDIFLCPLR
jgi:hypothetical protein